MSPSHRSSFQQTQRDRKAFARKLASRQELDSFFVQCLDFMRSQANRRGQHAGALSDSIAALAFQKFGALAPNVMHHWGIDTPEELEKSFFQYLLACGSRGVKRSAGFAQSEALQALFRGEFWL